MSSRRIIEDLCLNGDNVWQTGMAALRLATIVPLLEAWTPERKSEIVAANAAKKDRIILIDHAVLDNYDLTLWKIESDKEPFAPFFYAVSLNSEQHDPTDAATQVVKIPGSSLRHLPVSSIADVLRRWVGDYGEVVVGSVNPRKMRAYRRLLKDTFTIRDLPGGSDQGFYIS